MRRTVLITGCSSGIGLAAAKTLQAQGFDVVASARKVVDVAHLKTLGLGFVVQLDLASSDSIGQAVDKVLTYSEGRLFGLFNNGAYGLPGAVEDLSRAALRRQFETNVFGTHELTRALIPTMLTMADARIVQNSSVLGLVPMPARGAYIASKFALEGLTQTLRLELADTPIKVSIIQPGPITSRFRQNALAALEADVDIANSRHSRLYQKSLARLNSEGPAMPFTLTPDAVVKKLLHALESSNPHPCYGVTVQTHLMSFLKRVLTTRALERFILKFGKP